MKVHRGFTQAADVKDKHESMQEVELTVLNDSEQDAELKSDERPRWADNLMEQFGRIAKKLSNAIQRV